MRGRRCEARSEAPAEREFPALLVCIAGCLGVPADPNIFWNFFFSRVSAKKNIGHFSPFRGVFVLLGGVFALLGGVFALLGCFFLFFARQREKNWGGHFRRPTTPKLGIPALNQVAFFFRTTKTQPNQTRKTRCALNTQRGEVCDGQRSSLCSFLKRGAHRTHGQLGEITNPTRPTPS